MIISGYAIENNILLYSENEYSLDIAEIQTDFVTVQVFTINNNNENELSQTVRYYKNQNNEAKIYLSSLIKSIFYNTEDPFNEDFNFTPNLDNYITRGLVFLFYDGSVQDSGIEWTVPVIKASEQISFNNAYSSFIDYDTFTNGYNENTKNKIPFFTGYPNSVSRLFLLNRVNYIERVYLNNYDSLYHSKEIDYGCEGIYLKWYGGDGNYYYWLFSNRNEETFKTKSLGDIKHYYDYIGNTNRFSSHLGIKSKNEIEIETFEAVEKRYQNLFKTLIVSSEVYLYLGKKGTPEPKWIRVKPKTGSYKFNNYNPSEKFKLKLELPEFITTKNI